MPTEDTTLDEINRQFAGQYITAEEYLLEAVLMLTGPIRPRQFAALLRRHEAPMIVRLLWSKWILLGTWWADVE